MQLLLTTSSTPEFKSTHTSSHATPSPSHFPPVTPSQGTLPPSPSPVSTQFPLLTAIVPAVVVAMVTTLTIALILIVAQLHKRSKKKGSLRVTRRYSDTHQVMVTAWKDTSNGGYSSKQQQSVSLAGLASRQHATPHSPCAHAHCPASLSIHSADVPLCLTHSSLTSLISWDTQPLYHSPTHSNTHTLTHTITHTSLTHSLTHPLTHPPTHSLTHPLTHSHTHSPTHSHTHLLTHPPTHSHTHIPCSLRLLTPLNFSLKATATPFDMLRSRLTQ